MFNMFQKGHISSVAASIRQLANRFMSRRRGAPGTTYYYSAAPKGGHTETLDYTKETSAAEAENRTRPRKGYRLPGTRFVSEYGLHLLEKLYGFDSSKYAVKR